MKMSVVLGALGTAVGGLLAVLVHYLTHRQPYGSGYYAFDQLSNGSFLVHPHWWPMTALCLGGGLVCGLAVALGLLASGRQVRLVPR